MGVLAFERTLCAVSDLRLQSVIQSVNTFRNFMSMRLSVGMAAARRGVVSGVNPGRKREAGAMKKATSPLRVAAPIPLLWERLGGIPIGREIRG
jgi:hypothetical protein